VSVYFQGNILILASGDPWCSTGWGCNCCQTLHFTRVEKTVYKRGVRHEMPAGRPFHCRYSLQNRAAV